ncbi:MAG: metallophosphoesterase family protein [Planctomycetota bacterium]
MILGVLSDTHGHVLRCQAALRVLERLGAQAFVHCGDVGGLEVIESLRGALPRGARGWVVCGNTDFADPILVKYGELQGLQIAAEGPLRAEADGRKFVVFHGHENAFGRLLAQVERTGRMPDAFAGAEYVLHGHTHVPASRVVGPLRVINPGALHRAVVYTVATLDLHSGELRFWQVSGDGTGEPVEYQPKQPVFP